LNLQGNAGDVGKVEAFLNEVGALLKSGRLVQEQAQVLQDEGLLLLLSLPQ
jgi:hypothetical protein